MTDPTDPPDSPPASPSNVIRLVPAGLRDASSDAGFDALADALPCPWCGEDAHADNIPDERGKPDCTVHCHTTTCQAIGPTRRTEREAIVAWNAVAGLVYGMALLAEADLDLKTPEGRAGFVDLQDGARAALHNLMQMRES